MTVYPEHEKLRSVAEQSQVCGEFLDWLANEKCLHLAEWVDGGPGYRSQILMCASYSTQRLLAEFFEIDLDALEREKRAMLEDLVTFKAKRLGES